ncbi:MAG: hypothetical protein CL878_01860 [Dehalococcoidia bacterium]|nr:hypothetical protein [Dehalococcoidia bacterium]
MTGEPSAQLAEQFAHYIVPTLMQVAVRVVRIAAIEPRDAVLDLGTTTGIAAFLAAAQADRDSAVVGVDTSAAMLAIAEQRSRLAGAQHVRWHVGDAAALDFAHESFDAVLCIHLLHDLARPDEALAEVYRVLAPGGRISLAVWGSAANNRWATLAARAAKAAGGPVVRPRPDVFSLASPGAVEILLQHAGFAAIESERVRDKLHWSDATDLWKWYTAWPHLGATLRDLPAATQTRAQQQLSRLTEPYRDGDALTIPREVVYARAIVPPD